MEEEEKEKEWQGSYLGHSTLSWHFLAHGKSQVPN